ncbi:uncharacterized protein LOC112126272 [Cimex lectularius]|uniref:C2H2-type domain-containing protein n=1 Tax=Cimex lectularius TaxID=79782 RepID=A0A8I6TIF0_CIMLE|nr:uncharacterized protein LOC112126272 [Cimex lectularius]
MKCSQILPNQIMLYFPQKKNVGRQPEKGLSLRLITYVNRISQIFQILSGKQDFSIMFLIMRKVLVEFSPSRRTNEIFESWTGYMDSLDPFFPGRMRAGFTCVNCLKNYKWKGALYRHLRYECGQSAQFSCKFCGYQTKQKCNLRRHVATRHRDEINAFIQLRKGSLVC